MKPLRELKTRADILEELRRHKESVGLESGVGYCPTGTLWPMFSPSRRASPPTKEE
jgi:hypothetical protein